MRWKLCVFVTVAMAGLACSDDGDAGTTGSGGTGGQGTGGSGTGGRGGSTGGSGGTSASGGSGGASASGGSGGSTGGSGGSSTGGTGTGGSGGSSTGGSGTGGSTASDAGGTGDGPASDAPAGDGPSAATPGMVKIFDGSSWDGWEYDPRCWKLVDRAMRGQCPSGQSMAFTKESYSNFRLILWSRMVQSNDHLGVCIWGGRPGAGSYGFSGCLLPQPPGGAFWDYATNTDHPTGGDKSFQMMWHKTEILANRMTGRVLMAVNGKLVHDYMDKQLARRKHGPIGMQIHKAGAYIAEYRDIEVEVDPKEDRLITLTPAP
jgi:hypothetical protein